MTMVAVVTVFVMIVIAKVATVVKVGMVAVAV